MGGSKMKHATKMILEDQRSIFWMVKKQMILRNDFRIPTPPQKSFPKVGVIKFQTKACKPDVPTNNPRPHLAVVKVSKRRKAS